MAAIGLAIDQSTRTGKIALALLNGSRKCLVVPFYGAPDEPKLSEEEYRRRGDGSPILMYPNTMLYQELPYLNMYGRIDGCSNVRAAVPTWLIGSSCRGEFYSGIGEVLAIGVIHPISNTAVMDVYRDGHVTSRVFIHDPKAPQDPDPEAATLKAEELNMERCATPGIPPSTTPLWQPQLYRQP